MYRNTFAALRVPKGYYGIGCAKINRQSACHADFLGLNQ
jgi:hypothetical protein